MGIYWDKPWWTIYSLYPSTIHLPTGAGFPSKDLRWDFQMTKAPKLNQRQVVSQRHRGATLCNPGTWDTSNFPMDFFGMFWSSGSNPLGGHQCLRRQEQQVRPGLQQGAGGLRHLPRLHHRGARTGSGREWPLGTGECWRARGTKKVGETCNGFEFLQSLWYIMMRREI